MKKHTWHQGFTLIEFLITMGMFAVISMLAGNALLSSSNHASLDTTANTFFTDLKQQQLKAMDGDTQSSSTNSNYGVYLQTNYYTLFSGNTYYATGSGNIKVNLPTNITFTNITFPSSQIIFLEGSGEVQSYASSSADVTLKDTNDNNSDTIIVNRYGVITAL